MYLLRGQQLYKSAVGTAPVEVRLAPLLRTRDHDQRLLRRDQHQRRAPARIVDEQSINLTLEWKILKTIIIKKLRTFTAD